MSAEAQFSVAALGLSFESSGYNLAATTTLLLCDIFATLPSERKYIWSYHSRVNWTTLFYIITRYLPIIVIVTCILLLQFEASEIGVVCPLYFNGSNPFSDECYTANDGSMVSSESFARTFSILYTIPWFVVLGCTEILFVRRIVVLHEGSRLLSRILISLLICELLSALVLLFLFTFFEALSAVIIASIFGPSATSVMPAFLPETYFALPELVFQAILVMLIIKKVISDWKSGAARSNLGSILIRDGLWSYFCNLCGLLVIPIQPAGLGGPFGLPNILWSYASFSVTCSRLVLNVRAAAAKQPLRANNITSTTRTRARFAFVRDIRSFFASRNDALSTPYHYHDLQGHGSNSDDE